MGRTYLLPLLLSSCVFSRSSAQKKQPDPTPMTPTMPSKPPPPMSGPTVVSGSTTTLCAACQKNGDCGEDALCLVFDAAATAGFCGRVCMADKDCPGGFTCRAAGNSRQCVPNSQTCDGKTVVDQCESDSGCPVGQECRNGACNIAPPQACFVSTDCGAGTCVDGLCRRACANNAECTSQEVCDRGLCSPSPSTQCRASHECGAVYSCVDGRCLSACQATSDCITDEVCGPANVCERFAETSCDAGCRSDQRCGASVCRMVCSVASDCPNGWACDDRAKFCERDLAAAYCVGDSECPTGTTCTTHKCQ